MQLTGEELIRQFLLHILPKGLMRIRHYGFLANRCRKQKLAKIREALGHSAEESAETKPHDWPCPKCHPGQLRVQFVLSPIKQAGG